MAGRELKRIVLASRLKQDQHWRMAVSRTILFADDGDTIDCQDPDIFDYAMAQAGRLGRSGITIIGPEAIEEEGP